MHTHISKKTLEIAYMAVKMGFGLEESLLWMKNKLEKDLKFLKEMSKELDIKDVIRECGKHMNASHAY